ncbi:ABC transporter ATP-binding protein [Candidatus Bipolaricaulota bacterium]|nr:ABC transporter ATP-binding protein [Candidatus Bipolaricaulota bacterium]
MVELVEAVKTYKLGKTEVRALRGVSLSVKEGEFVAIMGPSGSGKSTLLHVIGCLDRPDQGRVYLNGQEVSGLSEDRLAEFRGKFVGFVFQTFNLVPTLSALENVELPMTFQGVPRKRRLALARELLVQVGLGERLRHRPAELSGGERQRVAIARALVNDPKLILADEPTGNLDSASGAQVMELLKGLNEEQDKTLIVVTHDPEIASYAGRTVHIRDGRIQEVAEVQT